MHLNISHGSCFRYIRPQPHLAIGDWLKVDYAEWVELFQPPKDRLLSYSTIRRALLRIEDPVYSACSIFSDGDD